jgi:hypothetical protein
MHVLVFAALLGLSTAAPRSKDQWPLAVQWSNCTESGPPFLQCGKLQVPIDHNNPQIGNLTLAMARLRANSTNRLGSLIYNPGGPGRAGEINLAHVAMVT